MASGADASFDSLISLSTLVGAGIFIATGVNLDGWIGAAISLFIIKAGLEMLLGGIAHVMDRRPDAAITKEIRATAAAVPGVLGVHGIFFDDAAKTVSFDVLVDFTVRDRPALRDAFTAELAPPPSRGAPLPSTLTQPTRIITS